MSAPDRLASFWARRCAALPAGATPPRLVEAVAFGAGELADRLLALARAGTKTATAMPLWAFEASGRPLWAVGDESILLDGSGAPRCAMVTTELRVVPFDALDAPFARDYGEGDRTLARFRSEAWEYYGAVAAELGHTPARDMPMICERFRVVYRE